MTAALAKLIFFIAAAASYVIRHPHQRRARRTPVRASVRDRQENVLIGIAAIGLGLVPLVYVAAGFPAAADYPFVPAAAWLGTATFGLALWLFYRAHRDLGRNFSARLKLRESHVLVTGGVYKRIRHPIYAAFWLYGLAQALLLPNWIAGPAGLVGFGVLFFCRVGREERMMIEAFGENYRAYMARTWRVVPWLY
jgi:protein-S-isoprenylcysteine O-methyltransferase Ste14